MCWNYSVSGNSDFLESVCRYEVGGLLPQSLVVDCRPLVGLQHVDRVKELLSLFTGFLVQIFITRLLLHGLHRDLMMTMSPPVPFGPSTDHGPPIGRSVIPVADVSIRTAVFVLDNHQICWHLLKLIDKPLPFHFG